MRVHDAGRLGGPALAVVLAAGAFLSGCAGGQDDRALAPELEAEIPDIRGDEDLDDPYVGLLDARFVEDLPAYAEQEVTVLAEVEEVLSARTFSVTTPGGSDVEPVLVVTAEEAADVQPRTGDELVIAATPVDEFEAEVVAEELDLAVDPELLEEWEDQAFLLATILEPAP